MTYSSSAVSLAVEPTSLVLAPNQEETLTATTGGGSGNVTWATSNSSIVSISSSTGTSITVKGHALGNATITASYSTAEDVEIPITVYQLSGSGTQADPYTCSDVYFLASQLEVGTNGGEVVYASGTVLEVTNFNTTYNSATFTMTDGTRTVVAYGINNASQNITDSKYIGTNCQVVVSGAIINHSTSGYEIGYVGSSLTSNLVSSNKGTLSNVDAVLASQVHSVGDLLTVEDFIVTLSYSFNIQGVASSGFTWTVNGTSGETTTLKAKNNAIVVSFGGLNSTTLYIDLTPIVGSYYEKVTSTSQITTGQYLIVCEDSSVAFDGSLGTFDAVGNIIDVSISDGKIGHTNTTEASEFTIDVSEKSIKGKSGKYIGVNSYSNGLVSSSTAVVHNAFSIDGNGNAVISITFENGDMSLKYNATSDQTRFRYYKSGQKDVQLYKFVEVASEAPAFAQSFLEMLSTGTDSVCDADGNTDLEELQFAWAYLAEEYDDLSADDKLLFSGGNADEDSDDVIEQALALYDYIAGKYNTQLESDDCENYNFMGRTISGARPMINVLNVSDNSAAVTAIVVVMALVMTTAGAYFLLRKKKEVI